MSIVFFLLMLAESMALIILFLPFGVLAYAEIARAARLPGREGLPKAVPLGVRLTRWHIAAALLVIPSAVILPIRLAFDDAVGDIEPPVVTSPSDLVFSLIEVSLWLVILAALYGPMYAVRLRAQRVHGAELIGLGLCLFPSTLLTITLFTLGTDPVLPLVFGIVGVVLFPFGAVMPGRWVKTVLLTSACVAMLMALTDLASPANPVWLLTVIAMGYTVFRSEWRHSLETSPSVFRGPALATEAVAGAEISAAGPRSTSTLRTIAFLVVNIVSVCTLWVVWRIGFGANDTAPASAFALTGFAIATIGAALTAMALVPFRYPRSDLAYAAATFVVVLVAASVMQLIAAPQVEGYVFGTSASVQLWKPVLGTFACIGALLIAMTTLTGKKCQIRPLMIGIILPAAFLLPSDTLFTFIRDDSFISWTQRLLETGITISLLAIMWYVFGPGRRPATGT